MFRPHYAACMIGCAAALAPAQDAMLEIRVLNDATPANPVVELEVWAHVPPGDYALSGVVFTLDAFEPAFIWIDDCRCGPPSHMLPDSIWVIASGSVHFPPSIYADPTTPMRLYRAGWRTTDFTRRTVELTTDASDFEVYPERESPRSESRLGSLLEPGAVIRILDSACYADCDGSGALDFGDFLCYQNDFAASDPLADCDLDGQLDFFDFLCFQNAFAAGCP